MSILKTIQIRVSDSVLEYLRKEARDDGATVEEIVLLSLSGETGAPKDEIRKLLKTLKGRES